MRCGLDVAREFQLTSRGEVCPRGDCVKLRLHSGDCGNADDFKRALSTLRPLTECSDHEEEKHHGV